MLHALQALNVDDAFTVEVVDVDADASLVAQYDELVPVLVGVKKSGCDVEQVQLCHYFLDEQKIRQFLD